jgi:ATP-dependent helicase/nuclease subunit A
MSLVRQIPDAATARQIAAADPERSVFVSANAGSGKTHVLVQRVINLLLRGEDPAKILCITFTKAAAANMATRVFETLAEWTALDDAAVDKKIRLATGKTPSATQRSIARRLFANALETPGGLKVQTIHAFCTRLLHQFPFEADVAARFDVLDEAATSQLLNELTLEVLLEGATEPQSPLSKALADAITSAADVTFKEVIAEAIGKRDLITRWTGRTGGVRQAIDELTSTFGLQTGDTIAAVEAEYLAGSLIPQNEWPALIDIFSAGSKNDQERAHSLSAAISSTGRERIENYLDVFCTADRRGRSNILTKRLADANLQWTARLSAEKERVCSMLAREFAIRARDRSAALITVAAAVIERYRAEKERRGLLDYEDLIDKTLELLRDASTKSTAAAWVLYKLDLGINHVLVDEAQDTSDKQWEIVKILVAEFLPGGARDNVRRTLFAVGDEKQSIFSFQGAVPHKFAEMRDHFSAVHEASDVVFATEKLDYSFRSAVGVLDAVDAVFRQPAAFRGLTVDPTWTVHQPLPDAMPGDVEIWDLIGPDEKDNKEGWDAPFDTTSETSPSVKLAAKIARTVKGWIAQGTRPRDVLILVRQRGPMFEAVIRALKQARIEVAGADRLVLTEHIAIMDLLVLGDALLLPDNDLALATVLKSPLFGFDDDKLFKLAYQRKGPLRSALRVKAGEDAAFGAALSTLDAWEQKARILSPFAFYAHVLGAHKGRAKIFARLGTEASDPLDEFLNLALSYEQRETPSLQGFLNWIRVAQSEVKRDMAMARDEVRVMTVHGAKGLEAKNVILIDHTTTRPEGAHPPRLLTAPIVKGPPGAAALIWGVAKDKDAGPMAQARQQAIEAACDEYRRLLYVALTRAADRLLVCGAKGIKRAPEGCWHDLVLGALQPLSEEARDEDGRLWRFRKGLPVTADQRDQTPQPRTELPAWLKANATASPRRVRIVRPSDAPDEEDISPAGRGVDRKSARLRGRLAHRLLQSLPDIPTARRRKAADNYLARNGREMSEDERAQLAERIVALLNDERFRGVFSADSRAEVPIVGTLDGGREILRVSGQIDRLAVTPDAVLIVDFKTNTDPPRRFAEVPDAYKRQLALYRAVLQKIYPSRPVRAALIWTEVPDLMELSAEILDEALRGVTSP